jgi:hypothetical protein
VIRWVVCCKGVGFSPSRPRVGEVIGHSVVDAFDVLRGEAVGGSSHEGTEFASDNLDGGEGD